MWRGFTLYNSPNKCNNNHHNDNDIKGVNSGFSLYDLADNRSYNHAKNSNNYHDDDFPFSTAVQSESGALSAEGEIMPKGVVCVVDGAVGSAELSRRLQNMVLWWRSLQ